MRNMYSKFSLSLVLLLTIFVTVDVYGQDETDPQSMHTFDLSRWGIYNDGTHPVETTKGINDALIWANKNAIKSTALPSGTYLIDKNSRINMVSNMLFTLPTDAVLKKETNDKERYDLMYLGYGVKNVTLRGGTYAGDKKTHDYSKKDNIYSSGTHEGGHGIVSEGATNIVVDGVKSIDFTGDGLVLGGKGTMVQDLYESGFVSGGLDNKGLPVNNSAKIRTKTAVFIKNPIFNTEKYFELSNFIKVPKGFEVYFYNSDGSFLKKIYSQARKQVDIPKGADRFHLVFSQTSTKGVYLEVWNRVATQNVTVKNSEFAFNRRQGITVGGANNVLIKDSLFHDMKGTAPQSGIDVEGGFEVNGYFNSNITIKNNEFYNNAAYDLILFDGQGALVEDNHFASKGVIGLAVSLPFKDAEIVNNHFDGARISADDDAVFIGNKMNDSYTYFQGPNIKIDGMELTDSRFAVSAKDAFGIEVSNITINNNKKSDSGLSIYGKPIRITNMTITGEGTLRSVVGGGAGGSIFENLVVQGYNSAYGLSLPPGTYNNCKFEAEEGSGMGSLSGNLPGSYIFNGCSFKTNSLGVGGLYFENKDMDVTVKNSTFEIKGNTPAINVQSAKSVLLENNTVTAMNQTINNAELLKLNSYWDRDKPYDILSAVIRGNTITSNMQAYGISTQYAGVGAPPYIVENNKLIKAKLFLKANDQISNNTVTSQ